MDVNNSVATKIKQAINHIDASAQIILFGSRARGEAKAESDWDILILLNKPKVTSKDEQLFRHELFSIELETGHAISTFVYSMNDWNTKMTVTSFYQNVKEDGIYL